MTQSRQGRVISVFVWPTAGNTLRRLSVPAPSGRLPPSAHRAATWALCRLRRPAQRRPPAFREAAKRGGFDADFAVEKNNDKSSDTPLLSVNYYGIM